MLLKINTHGNPMPECHGEWVDLATAEDVTLMPNEFKVISFGISIEMPRGYYAQILPRSSTFKKWGIIMTNGTGIIENEYCGDDDIWGFPALNMRGTVFIPKGTRIAQFCVKEREKPITFLNVPSLGNNNRGGFGSTGD